ncbi:DUF4238 domain-containing protein [Kitasatospora sp. NPDC088134]|uniref:DUF4238 domain-containing protein n=1 Tax=Kitasatospora sp. NPDC088134 TaxID=3364071 RepID=UPI00381BE98C
MDQGPPRRWLSEAQRMDARIAELRPQADRRVVGQHVISRVLLRRFAAPIGSAGYQVLPFDLRHPARLHKVRGVGACGRMNNFAPFASASLEEVRGRLETQVPEAAKAVDRGDVFQSEQYVRVLKDLIALHWVRSLHFRAVHQQIFNEVYTEHRTALLTHKSGLLRAAVLQRYRLHLPGPAGLAAAADELLRPQVENFASGADFRVRIEEAFGKAKEIIGSTGLEILVPEEGEFLLGDIPALTVCQDGGIRTYGMALGDSTGVVLPFGPRHLLVGRTPRNGFVAATAATVKDLNHLQIEAARRHVYLRPHSALDGFVRNYLDCGGRSSGD